MQTAMIQTGFNGQPDPATQPDFYTDIPTKRLIAWFVDVLLISVLTFAFTLVSLLSALLVLPLVFAAIGFLYRWVSLSRSSATPGMRLVSIQFLRPTGDLLDTTTAFLHTAGYYVSVAIFPLQLISIALILLSERKQSLTDMVLGTVAVNLRSN